MSCPKREEENQENILILIILLLLLLLNSCDKISATFPQSKSVWNILLLILKQTKNKLIKLKEKLFLQVENWKLTLISTWNFNSALDQLKSNTVFGLNDTDTHYLWLYLFELEKQTTSSRAKNTSYEMNAEFLCISYFLFIF